MKIPLSQGKFAIVGPLQPAVKINIIKVNEKIILLGSKVLLGVNIIKNGVPQIWINQKKRFLGYFDGVEEATKAYNKVAKKYHGEFICLK